MEKRLANSKIREVFTPYSPVSSGELLSGRESEVAEILGIINTPGQHALIYGDRGVGKSSVANTIAQIMNDAFGKQVHIKKCSSLDTFTNIIEKVLSDTGVNTATVESIEEFHEGKDAKAGVAGFGASLKSEKKKVNKTDYREHYCSPAWVADYLAERDSLLIIDEADVIQDDITKVKLAEFIKHLSDSNSKFKVLVVGIGTTGKELVSNHLSIERCLSEVYLPLIRLSELRDIVVKGSLKTCIDFSESVIDDIVDISCGYPHFVHLIALKCAEDAVMNRLSFIDSEILPRALAKAVECSEGALRRKYEYAIKPNNNLPRKILLAAALCHPRGFLIAEVCEMINEVIERGIKRQAITSLLNRWVNDPELNIIMRVERGHYKFSDPRMMSFIKMINGFTYDKNNIVSDILREEYAKRYVS